MFIIVADPILYADDTLILTRGNAASVRELKSILDDLSLATGLSINTFLMADALGLCRGVFSPTSILFDCLRHFSLSNTPDMQSLSFHAGRPFSRDTYNAVHQDGPTDPDVVRFWATKLPTKIRFFGWLLHHGRLNTLSESALPQHLQTGGIKL